MTILLVGNDKAELNTLKEHVTRYYPDEEILVFTDSKAAVTYAESNIVDICFTSVIMKKVTGIALTKEIRKTNPDVSINFIADDESFALDGWRLHINDYLVRPVTAADVAHTIRDDVDMAF